MLKNKIGIVGLGGIGGLLGILLKKKITQFHQTNKVINHILHFT